VLSNTKIINSSEVISPEVDNSGYLALK